MNHKIKVGKPIVEDDEIVGYEEVKEIPTNQIFRWNRRGFKAIPEAEQSGGDQAPEVDDETDGEEDLYDLTVKKLKVIADSLGVEGKPKLKADLIEAIEAAQQEAGE